MIKKRVTPLLLLLCVFVLPAAKCNKESTYQKVALASKTFADTLNNAQDGEIKLYQQGMIQPAEHQAVQKTFVQTAQAGKELDNAIRAAHDEKSVIDAFGKTVAEFNVLLDQGVLHIKNPEAQRQVKGWVLVAETALATIQSVVGTQPGVTSKVPPDLGGNK